MKGLFRCPPEGMNCGADAYIEKPFSMKYLEI